MRTNPVIQHHRLRCIHLSDFHHLKIDDVADAGRKWANLIGQAREQPPGGLTRSLFPDWNIYFETTLLTVTPRGCRYHICPSV